MTQYTSGSRGPDVGIVNSVNTPADRIRWGAIIGGLFAAMATLVVLGVLGMAIGLTAYEPGDQVGEGFAWGAAIWGIITAIAAFFLGGWLAGRTAAFQGHRNGLINGTMVWATSVALVVLLLGSGITALVGASAQAVGGMAMQMQSRQERPMVQPEARPAAGQIDMQVSEQAIERADRGATSAAWLTLVSLLIGLGAAALGGYTGSRAVPEDVVERRAEVR